MPKFSHSSFLSLLPYRTRALTQGDKLAAHLPDSCVYAPWVDSLQAFFNRLGTTASLPWGVYSPGDILLDGGAYSLTSSTSGPVIRNENGNGKLKTKVLRGLGALTTACLLYDLLVWLEGPEEMQSQVLQHARRDLGFGKMRTRWFLPGLTTLMSTFMQNATNLGGLAMEDAIGLEASASRPDDFVQSMEAEYVALCSGKRAITVVKNILYLAYTIRVMFNEGQITIPEDALKGSRGKPTGLLGKDVFDLRRALLAALAISPLIALVSTDLCNSAPCVEETILNCKHYGNIRPPALLSIERVIWTEILAVAKGVHSAMQALRNLRSKWVGVDWDVELNGCTEYFQQASYEISTSAHSLVEATIVGPIPPSWPIPTRSCVRLSPIPPRDAAPLPPRNASPPPPQDAAPLPSRNATPDPLQNHEPNVGTPPLEEPLPRCPVASPGLARDPVSLENESSDIESEIEPETIGDIDPSSSTAEIEKERLRRQGEHALTIKLPPAKPVTPNDNPDEARRREGNPKSTDPSFTDTENKTRPRRSLRTSFQEPDAHPKIAFLRSSTNLGGRPRKRRRTGGARAGSKPNPKDGENRNTGDSEQGEKGEGDSEEEGRDGDNERTEGEDEDLDEGEKRGDKGNDENENEGEDELEREGKDEDEGEDELEERSDEEKDELEQEDPKPADTKPPPKPPQNAKRRNSKKRPSMGSSSRNPIVIDQDDIIVIDDDDADEPSEATISQTKRVQAKVLHHIENSIKYSPTALDEKPPLTIEAEAPRYSDRQTDVFPIFDLDGHCHMIKPPLATKSDYAAWARLLGLVVGGYTDVNGTGTRRPLHLDDPEKSIFSVVKPETFRQKSTRDIQTLFGRCNIVIPKDLPGEAERGEPSDGDSASKSLCEFSLEDLEEIGDVHHVTHVHDQHFSVKNHDHQTRVMSGRLVDLYNSTQLPYEKQKSLNALDFPDPYAQIAKTPYASDVRAVFRTAKDPGGLQVLPTNEIRWTIVGTEGAHSYFHTDPRGEATYIYLACGEKLWVVAVPKVSSDIASTEVFSGKDFDVMDLDSKRFRFEVAYLRRGDKLIMQPATLHAVLTLQPCIAYGGHFLATSALARTIIGGVHTFFEGSVITNTDHPSILTRLDSVISFLHKTIALGQIGPQDEGHLPIFNSVQALQDIITVACGIELQNATCTQSYDVTTDPVLLRLLQTRKETAEDAFHKHDISNMPYQTRCMAVYSRGRMRDLLRVVFKRTDIRDQRGLLIADPWHDVFVPSLAWFIASLESYYKDSVKIQGHNLPELPHFQRQLAWTASHSQWPTLAKELNKLKGKKVSNFVIPIPVSQVHPKVESPLLGGERVATELFRAGMRRGDYAYFSVVTPAHPAINLKRPRSSSAVPGSSKKTKT